MASKLHRQYMKVVERLVKEKTKDPKIELILLGGSVARGDEMEHSDIDINFFVKRKDMPEYPRSFYKYYGKYIEENILPIESLRKSYLPSEVKVLYNGRNMKINISQNETERRKVFLGGWSKARRYQRLAEKYFNEQDYKKAVLHILGTESLSHVLVHALPQRFDLPSPTFRLLTYVKEASMMLGDKRIYRDIALLYTLDRPLPVSETLDRFEEAYRIIRKCKKNMHPDAENLGFYSLEKIKSNMDEMRAVARQYPEVFVTRFIVGCMVDWAFGNDDLWKVEANKEHRKMVTELTEWVLYRDINREFVKEKMELSMDLERRTNKSMVQ